MKFSIYRSKKREAPEVVNLDLYTYEDDYVSETKGTLTSTLAQNYISGKGRPLSVGDLLQDENKRWWILTEHFLWAEVKVKSNVSKF